MGKKGAAKSQRC